jgi:glycosyltransferase involved in cell wall biosynthesis
MTKDRHTVSGPRILHLIPSDGVGGVEVAAKSMQVRNDLPCNFRLQFIEPAAPKGRTLASAARALGAHWRALAPARAFEPDVIVCSLWRSVPLALVLRTLHRRAKLVYFIHIDATTHRVDAVLSAVATRMADAIWGDSAATLAARGVLENQREVISFVTERMPLIDKPFGGPHFVSWGRLHRQKGFDRGIRFIGFLVARGIDAHYVIYGPDDGERDALLALICDLGLEGRVRLMGSADRSELARIAASYTFFLQPSRSEGMCMSAVEAMQRGLVPVTTAVGEMAYYVVPGRTGIFIDPDDMGPAADAVVALVDDPVRWRRHSQAAMRHWYNAPLYADDVCRAAAQLVGETTT